MACVCEVRVWPVTVTCACDLRLWPAPVTCACDLPTPTLTFPPAAVSSYRFPDLFPDVDLVRGMQTELDELIRTGVVNITRLLRNSETGVTSGVSPDDEDRFEMLRRGGGTDRTLSEAYSEARGRAGTRGGGRGGGGGGLADSLVKEGVITKEMLVQLRRELLGEAEEGGRQGKGGGRKGRRWAEGGGGGGEGGEGGGNRWGGRTGTGRRT